VKTLLPTGLAPVYEFPPDFYLFNWRVILAAIIFLMFSLGLFVARHRWPSGLTCWIVYLLLLAPVSGGCPKWPTAGRGSLQLSIVHGLGDTFGDLAFPRQATGDF
jgi:hypothetical protein